MSRQRALLAVFCAAVFVAGVLAVVVHDEPPGEPVATTASGIEVPDSDRLAVRRDATTSSSSSTAATSATTSTPGSSTTAPSTDPQPVDPDGDGPIREGPGAARPDDRVAFVPPDIIIGTVGTWTGLGALDAGRAVLEAWVEAINEEGGLAGRSVGLLEADDGGDQGRHDALVADVLPHVQLFIDLSVVADPGSAQLAAAGVPAIGPALSDRWHQSPMLFPVDAGPTGQVAALSRLAKSQGHTKIGVVYCNELAMCRQAGEAIPAAAASEGVEVVYSAAASVAQPGSGECAGSARAGATAVVTLGARTLAVVAACNQWELPVFAWPPDMNEQLATSSGADGLTGITGVVPWFIEETGYADLVERVGATFVSWTGRETAFVEGQTTMAAYAAARLLEAAAAAGGGSWSPIPSPAQIVSSLHAVSGTTLGGITGPLVFEAGAPAPDNGCGFVVSVAGGAWEAPNGSTPGC